MSILESARELANAIENSPELRRVKEAELRLMLDIEARELVENFVTIMDQEFRERYRRFKIFRWKLLIME